MTHELKTVQPHFDFLARGDKTFEIRLNDRNFRCSDDLICKEWDGKDFTGRKVHLHVTHVLYISDGLKDGYVIMSVKTSEK